MNILQKLATPQNKERSVSNALSLPALPRNADLTLRKKDTEIELDDLSSCKAPVPRDFAPKSDEVLLEMASAMASSGSDKERAKANLQRLAFGEAVRLYTLIDDPWEVSRVNTEVQNTLKKRLQEASPMVGNLILSLNGTLAGGEHKGSLGDQEARILTAVMKGGFGLPVRIPETEAKGKMLVVDYMDVSAEDGEKVFKHFIKCVELTDQVTKQKHSSLAVGKNNSQFSYLTLKNGSTLRLILSTSQPDALQPMKTCNFIHLFRMPSAECPEKDVENSNGKNGEIYPNDGAKAAFGYLIQVSKKK